jgi:hypothetical protein
LASFGKLLIASQKPALGFGFGSLLEEPKPKAKSNAALTKDTPTALPMGHACGVMPKRSLSFVAQPRERVN